MKPLWLRGLSCRPVSGVGPSECAGWHQVECPGHGERRQRLREHRVSAGRPDAVAEGDMAGVGPGPRVENPW